MFGIENLKKLVGFACGLTKQISTSLKDGWQWTDALAFIDEVSAIPGAIKSLPAVKQEIADLSEDEKTELHAYIKEEFDIPDDKVELLIEDSITWTMATINLVNRWKTA